MHGKYNVIKIIITLIIFPIIIILLNNNNCYIMIKANQIIILSDMKINIKTHCNNYNVNIMRINRLIDYMHVVFL